MKPRQQSKQFCITLSEEELKAKHSLLFKGIVTFKEYPADSSSRDSDWDFYGYNEFEDILFTYIVLYDHNEDGLFISEHEIDPEDYEKFSDKLNKVFGF